MANDIAGLLLIGGLSRRMNGTNKGLMDLGGKTLLEHGLNRLSEQTHPVAINANHDLEQIEQFRVPVVKDTFEGYQGPLAGILAGMEWARDHAPNATWLMTAAGDSPFFPNDLVSKLKARLGDSEIVLATAQGVPHPIFGLWHLDLSEKLRKFMEQETTRKVRAFTDMHRLAFCPIEPVIMNGHEIDPFFNINRPQDLDEARELLATSGTLK